jgi:putative ABC transport system permease protein
VLRLAFKSVVSRKARLFLTSLAVILGTSFLAGATIFTDTLNKTFDTLFAEVFQEVDGFVRSTDVIETDFGGEERARISIDYVDRITSVPGVADAQGFIQTFARIVGKDGKPIGSEGNGPPTFGGTFNTGEIELWGVSEGRAPTNGNEVMLDESSAKDAGYVIGDTVKVTAAAGSREFTMVGIANYGDVSSPGGATFALFDDVTAMEFLTQPGLVDAILVAGNGSVDNDQLARDIQGVFGPSDKVETLTGDEITKETQDQIGAALDFLGTFLKIFSYIALGVAAFVIYNVFSISAAQRERENALMRAVGASKKQIRRIVLIEALVIGVVGSALGILAGIGISRGLSAMLKAFGVDLPSRGLTVTSAAITGTLQIGVVVTLVSAYFPARAAGKVPPLAAMRSTALETIGSMRTRLIVGFTPLLAGIALVVAVVAGLGAAWLGLAILLVFSGVLILGPVTSRPLAMFIGSPIAKVRGVTGEMARQNAARNPKRTARTAAPVLIGVALVTAVTALAASLRAEVRDIVGEQFRGDYVVSVTSQGFGGLSPLLVDDINTVEGVAKATAIGYTPVLVNDKSAFTTVVDPTTSEGLFELAMLQGDLASLSKTGILVEKDKSEREGWSIGTPVPLKLSDGTTIDATIEGIYDSNDFVANTVVSRRLFEGTGVTRFDQQIYIEIQDGVDTSTVEAALDAAIAEYGNGKVQGRSEFIDEQANQVNQLLGLIYGLLALSVIIAAVGIVITLLLSVYERRRELGLLRAVGMTRSQVRTSVRWESVITSLIGAVAGVILGLGLGFVIILSLADQGLSNYAFPVNGIIAILILSFIVGVLASVYPAYRATRVDVLDAITTT